MARWIDLDTPHGPVRAWRADPAGPSRGAVVVIQEIFGVNAHIRSVAERFAAAGFVALAPALFDPVERGVELGYDEADVGARPRAGRRAGHRARGRRARRGRRAAAGRRPARRRGRVLLGRQPRLPLQYAPGPACGQLLRRAQRAVPRRAGARADDVPLRRARRRAFPPQDIDAASRRSSRRRRSSSTRGRPRLQPRRRPDAHEPASAALAWQRTTDFLAENLR